MDALFWKNFGLVRMWTEIKWRPPLDQEDRAGYLLSTTLQCFEKARELSGGSIQLPEEEIQEMQTLLTLEDYYIPKPGLIGYYRLDRRTRLTGNWSILLPGYFYESDETEENQVRYFHKDKSIFAHSHSDLRGIVPEFPVDEEIDQDNLGVFTFENDTCVGKATLIRAPESEGGYQMLICHVAVLGSLCTVMLAMDNDDDIDWAIETFKSIEPQIEPTYTVQKACRNEHYG